MEQLQVKIGRLGKTQFVFQGLREGDIELELGLTPWRREKMYEEGANEGGKSKQVFRKIRIADNSKRLSCIISLNFSYTDFDDLINANKKK